MNLTIGYLYADLMNIYGDSGNIIALKKRAEWRGIKVQVKNVSVKGKLKQAMFDIFFFGGGQDQQQSLVSKDLQKSNKANIIKSEVARGVPLLSVCGGYQLLGDYYAPHQGPKLLGIGLFKAYTVAGDKRMIGNIVIDSQFGKLVGFENHSGKTYLLKEAEPLGKVISGYGNNGLDHTEGCILKNAIGCYLHGSLLPKNNQLADWLLKKALETKYGKEVVLKPLDDSLEVKTHHFALNKFS